jgi:hypothetical protein
VCACVAGGRPWVSLLPSSYRPDWNVGAQGSLRFFADCWFWMFMNGEDGSVGPFELDHSKSIGVVDPRCPRCISVDVLCAVTCSVGPKSAERGGC